LSLTPAIQTLVRRLSRARIRCHRRGGFPHRERRIRACLA
jgi:hypothetical protein